MHAPVHVFILSCVHVLIWFMVLAYIGGNYLSSVILTLTAFLFYNQKIVIICLIIKETTTKVLTKIWIDKYVSLDLMILQLSFLLIYSL